jgi:hypothetical protein
MNYICNNICLAFLSETACDDVRTVGNRMKFVHFRFPRDIKHLPHYVAKSVALFREIISFDCTPYETHKYAEWKHFTGF